MTIVTAWPGATAQEMQDQVAEKIEKRLQELRWYDRSVTYTRPGLALRAVSRAWLSAMLKQKIHIERTRAYLAMRIGNKQPPWITPVDINTHQLFVISPD
ncbi:hypothetical protein D3C71_1331640 [compost metagenome]